MSPLEFLGAMLATARPRPSLIGAPTPRDAVTDALATLRDELAPDGAVRGTPADWAATTRATLREMFGREARAKHALALEFLHRDRRLAAGLWLSGLVDHVRVILFALQAAERQP